MVAIKMGKRGGGGLLGAEAEAVEVASGWAEGHLAATVVLVLVLALFLERRWWMGGL